MNPQFINGILKRIGAAGYEKSAARSLRYNGHSEFRSSPNIHIEKRKDGRQGIDIHISAETNGETVYIPVIVSESGHEEMVYNDFYVAEGATVTIVAGCGIHNDGCDDSRHDGVHTFHIGRNAKVTYTENHYASGQGAGEKIMNPITQIYIDEGAELCMNTAQLGGVDSSFRKTYAELKDNANLRVTEKLMTNGKQHVESAMEVKMQGEGSAARIISRSVAKECSVQIFHPKAIGNTRCKAHIQCDSIIMDQAQVCSIPEINACHVDAGIVHEAAIGRINNEQLIKLQTYGLSEQEAEAVIIESFLK